MCLPQMGVGGCWLLLGEIMLRSRLSQHFQVPVRILIWKAMLTCYPENQNSPTNPELTSHGGSSKIVRLFICTVTFVYL